MKLKIGSHSYDVIFKNLDDEAQPNSGYCNTTGNKITINNTLPISQQESTIVHEIIEAINFLYQLELKHNKIMTLETALYQILKDNYKINLIK